MCVVFHQGKFFVSYFEAHRVLVFNNAGQYLYDNGSEGSGDGQLRAPSGLAIDKCNRLIVCDAESRRLQLFTLDGKYVAKLAGSFLTIMLIFLVVLCLILEICLFRIKRNTAFMFSTNTVRELNNSRKNDF